MKDPRDEVKNRDFKPKFRPRRMGPPPSQYVHPDIYERPPRFSDYNESDRYNKFQFPMNEGSHEQSENKMPIQWRDEYPFSDREKSRIDSHHSYNRMGNHAQPTYENRNTNNLDECTQQRLKWFLKSFLEEIK